MLSFCFENLLTDTMKKPEFGWTQDGLNDLADRIDTDAINSRQSLELKVPEEMQYDFATGLGKQFNGINGLNFGEKNPSWDLDSLESWGEFNKNHPELSSIPIETKNLNMMIPPEEAQGFYDNIAKPLGIDPEKNTMSFWDKLMAKKPVIPNID